jgi:diguanylate cyclase
VSIQEFTALPLFTETAAEMLPMLRARLGFPTWLIARKRSADWVALLVDGRSTLEVGHSCLWTETLCARIPPGAASHLTPDVAKMRCHAVYPFAQRFNIASYLGVPLCCPEDGTLMGTLCAIDTVIHPTNRTVDHELLETCARALSRLVYADVRAAKQQRRAHRAESVALCDSLTGLYNRRGWSQLIRAEESRCRRHGHSACVASIDLDDLKLVNDSAGHVAGDELLRRAGIAIRDAIRTQDVAARLGGDEFAVLAVECSGEASTALGARLASALADAGISASIGVASRASDLPRAWHAADDAMYVEKRARKAPLQTATRRTPGRKDYAGL